MGKTKLSKEMVIKLADNLKDKTGENHTVIIAETCDCYELYLTSSLKNIEGSYKVIYSTKKKK